MLENLRKQGASLLIYLIFGVLILVFAVNFGPQSSGSSEGCSGSTGTTILEVGDDEVQQQGWLYVHNTLTGSSRARAEQTLEYLLRRELLAQEAAQRGLIVSDDLVDEQIKRGSYFLGGSADLDARKIYFREVDGEYFFNYEAFRNWIGQLGLNVGAFKEQYRREMQANLMEQILKQSVSASVEEARARFIHENTRVAFDAVTYDASKYRAAMRLGPADIERFLAGHGDEVKKSYSDTERDWKAVKPQVHVKQIFVARSEKPAAPAPAAPAEGKDSASPADGAPVPTPPPAAPSQEKVAPEATADGKPAAPPAAEEADPKQATLDKVRADLVAKTISFADAAKAHHEDGPGAPRGGDLGWRTQEQPALPDPKLNEAVKTMKEGDISEVIATRKGFYILTVAGKREGDLSFDQVKHEIAARMAAETWSKEAAKRDALEALAKARSGTAKNLADMFERDAAPPPGGATPFDQIINDPNLTPEQKMEILKALQNRSGALEWESANIPAKWQGEAEPATAGGAPVAPAAGGGAPAPATADEKVADQAKLADAKAAGEPKPTEEPAAPAVVAPSTDVLPAFDKLPTAKVRRIGPLARDREDIPGLGKSRPLMRALFDELAMGNLASQVYEVDGNYVVVQVTEKEQAKIDDFEKDAAAQVAALAAERGEKLVESWLASRCKALSDAKKIGFNRERVSFRNDKGEPLPVAYRPCQSMMP